MRPVRRDGYASYAGCIAWLIILPPRAKFVTYTRSGDDRALTRIGSVVSKEMRNRCK